MSAAGTYSKVVPEEQDTACENARARGNYSKWANILRGKATLARRRTSTLSFARTTVFDGVPLFRVDIL